MEVSHSRVKDDADEQILVDFCRLGEVALEYNEMFGSHKRCIQNLEKFEADKNMDQMIKIVERL